MPKVKNCKTFEVSGEAKGLDEVVVVDNNSPSVETIEIDDTSKYHSLHEDSDDSNSIPNVSLAEGELDSELDTSHVSNDELGKSSSSANASTPRQAELQKKKLERLKEKEVLNIPSIKKKFKITIDYFVCFRKEKEKRLRRNQKKNAYGKKGNKKKRKRKKRRKQKKRKKRKKKKKGKKKRKQIKSAGRKKEKKRKKKKKLKRKGKKKKKNGKKKKKKMTKKRRKTKNDGKKKDCLKFSQIFSPKRKLSQEKMTPVPRVSLRQHSV